MPANRRSQLHSRIRKLRRAAASFLLEVLFSPEICSVCFSLLFLCTPVRSS